MRTSTKVLGISSLILLFILFNTDPQKMPSVVLIVPFVLLFVAIFSAIIFLLGMHGKLPRPKKARISAACASVPVVLLVLQSLGQLTPKDMLVIFLLFATSYFYISRLGVHPAS